MSWGNLGIAAGAAANSYRQMSETIVNNKLKEAQAAELDRQLKMAQAMADQVKQLPAVGTQGAALEYRTKDGETIDNSTGNGLKVELARRTAGMNPDDASAFSQQFMKGTLPTKFAPSYSQADRLRDIGNIAGNVGDFNTVRSVAQSLPRLRQEEMAADNEAQANKNGQDFKDRQDQYFKAQRAAQGVGTADGKPDYTGLNKVAADLSNQWNTGANHENGVKMKVLPSDAGPPSVQTTDSKGNVIDVHEFGGDAGDNEKFHHANMAMYMNDLYAVKPDFIVNGAKVADLSYSAMGKKQEVEEKGATEGIRAAHTVASTNLANAQAGHANATAASIEAETGAGMPQAKVREANARAGYFGRRNFSVQQGDDGSLSAIDPEGGTATQIKNTDGTPYKPAPGQKNPPKIESGYLIQDGRAFKLAEDGTVSATPVQLDSTQDQVIGAVRDSRGNTGYRGRVTPRNPTQHAVGSANPALSPPPAADVNQPAPAQNGVSTQQALQAGQ